MQYTIVHRDPQAFQQAVALEQIKAMCERAFGQGTPINAVRALDGGQFNNTYLIELAERDPVILRVAPPPARAVFWHERFLMRRELAMQKFLAPIAPLLPTILMSDFTHQILERDYLFQRWMPGSLWWDVQGDLTPVEHDDLWRQFGRLVQAISSVQGEAFGLVQAGAQFPTWSLALLEWRIGRSSCCHGVPPRRNRRSSGRPMGNREPGLGRASERRLTVTSTAYPRSINQPYAAWTATAS